MLNSFKRGFSLRIFQPALLPQIRNTRPTLLSISRAPVPRLSRTMSTPVFTKDACPPGPYSQAIKANGQVFVSGQIPADNAANLIEGSVADKTEQCCKNIAAILAAAGSSMEKVVKVNVFIIDMADFAEMNGAYQKHFPHKPARSCVAVHQLPRGIPVEIECIALQ